MKRLCIRFRLKKCKKLAKESMLVYMRITINSERVELSVNRAFEPSRWNQKAGRALGTKEDARTLNSYLELLQVRVHQAYQDILEANGEVTAEKLKNKLQGKEVYKPKMLLQIFSEHNLQIKKLVEQGDYAKGTHIRFETALRHTKTFLKRKYGIEDIEISKLDYGFINDFEFYLKANICAHNTAMKYLGNFKKIVLNCVRRNWLQRDPFSGYKLPKREIEKEFLVEEELQAIMNKKYSTERLTLVRDIFVFSCYTGLSYADVKQLKKSEVRTGIDGKQWLFVHRQKTGTPSAIPLLPIALSIINKYEQHIRCQASNKVLPVLCNQKMNEYLKEIAAICGINKTLTYHIARHTFATTVTLNNNVPIESLSRMLGHKNIRQTQHYAKVLNKKISLDMQILTEKLKDIRGIV